MSIKILKKIDKVENLIMLNEVFVIFTKLEMNHFCCTVGNIKQI